MEMIISKIESLYPIDSEFSDTSIVAKELLIRAIYNAGWRNLPKEFLAAYLTECENEEVSGNVTEYLKRIGAL